MNFNQSMLQIFHKDPLIFECSENWACVSFLSQLHEYEWKSAERKLSGYLSFTRPL